MEKVIATTIHNKDILVDKKEIKEVILLMKEDILIQAIPINQEIVESLNKNIENTRQKTEFTKKTVIKLLEEFGIESINKIDEGDGRQYITKKEYNLIFNKKWKVFLLVEDMKNRLLVENERSGFTILKNIEGE